MKHLNFIICMLLGIGSLSGLQAQEIMRSTVSASGGTSQITVGEQTFVVQQSVGQQSIIGTRESQSTIYRQGFIQPPIAVAIINKEDQTLQASLFPNPFESNLYIIFEEAIKGMVNVELFDLNGRLVWQSSENVDGQRMELTFGFLASASYVLRVVHANKSFNATLVKN